MKATWGDAETLFCADPAVTLKRIREHASAVPAVKSAVRTVAHATL
jgi:hypothetical protein